MAQRYMNAGIGNKATHFLFLGIHNSGFQYSLGKMLGLEKQSNYLMITILYLLLVEHKLAQRREGGFCVKIIRKICQ
jgi:hypothetical protein